MRPFRPRTTQRLAAALNTGCATLPPCAPSSFCSCHQSRLPRRRASSRRQRNPSGLGPAASSHLPGTRHGHRQSKPCPACPGTEAGTHRPQQRRITQVSTMWSRDSWWSHCERGAAGRSASRERTCQLREGDGRAARPLLGRVLPDLLRHQVQRRLQGRCVAHNPAAAKGCLRHSSCGRTQAT